MLKTMPPMIDPFGRRITYLRVSVTDRCDFRCVYCMAESPAFLPRKDLLTLEEIDRLASAFIAKGVRKVRLTGGEPLVRKNLIWLIKSLSRHLGAGLDELTLTTNGSQLARYAGPLANSGVARINVSLDTLDAAKFKTITRWGDLTQVMAGIDEADRAGIKIKINTVALRGVNEDEIEALLRWAHGGTVNVGIEHADLEAARLQAKGDIHRRGRFADAALARGNGNDVGDAGDGAGAMASSLRCAAGDRRSGWLLRSAAGAVAAARRRPSLAVGGEGDGDGLDSRHILYRLLGGAAQCFELRSPGRIDGNGEIDLAAANDDL